MPDLKQGARGVTTRLKKRQRGFHYEPEPGFYGVNKSFDEASKQKVASAQLRGIRRVLAKYALLDESGEPIESLAKLFAQSNFGYGDDPIAPKRVGDPLFGAPTDMPNEPGDRNGLSNHLSNGSV